MKGTGVNFVNAIQISNKYKHNKINNMQININNNPVLMLRGKYYEILYLCK